MDHAQVEQYGDAGILVRLTDPAQDARWTRAQGIAEALASADHAGVTDVVATYDTVFVSYNLLITDHDAVVELVREFAEGNPQPRARRTFRIPVVYGGDHGPDLEEVASELGMSAQDVIELHSRTVWTVRFRGAPAVAPMLDGAPWAQPIARCRTPRPRVPPGSVAVSGMQGVVYTTPAPGGWRLIGRTPARLINIRSADLAAYRPGDQIVHVAVPATSWDEWDGDLAAVSQSLGPTGSDADGR